MIRNFFLTLAFALLALPQLAQAKPQLRSHVSANGPVVTIGDFYEGAGLVADVPLFRSPDLGTSGDVPALSVAQRAQSAGLLEAGTDGLLNVTVSRASIRVDQDLILDQLYEAFAVQYGISAEYLSLSILSNLPERLHADPSAPQPIRLTRLDFTERSQRFSALMAVDLGSNAITLSLSGSATQLVDAVVLTRQLDRGSIISLSDLEKTRVPAGQLGRKVPLQLEEVAGMAIKRPTRAGRPLTKNDVSEPILVARGEAVIMSYQIPGLQLTTRGLAKTDGAMGDLIEVTNPTTRKVVLATVTGHNHVTIASQAPVMASLLERN